jgi:hypothetical protein
MPADRQLAASHPLLTCADVPGAPHQCRRWPAGRPRSRALPQARRQQRQLPAAGRRPPGRRVRRVWQERTLGCSRSWNPGPSAGPDKACDPALDREMQQAELLAQSDPPRARAIWQAVDRQLTNDAVWAPTVNIRDVELPPAACATTNTTWSGASSPTRAGSGNAKRRSASEPTPATPAESRPGVPVARSARADAARKRRHRQISASSSATARPWS